MPIFEYRCKACEHQFEELVTRPDEAVQCPKCGAETRKLFSTFAASVTGGSSAPCGSPSGSCGYSGGG